MQDLFVEYRPFVIKIHTKKHLLVRMRPVVDLFWVLYIVPEYVPTLASVVRSGGVLWASQRVHTMKQPRRSVCVHVYVYILATHSLTPLPPFLPTHDKFPLAGWLGGWVGRKTN